MTQNYLCIAIPTELQQFKKVIDITQEETTATIEQDFGVRLIKDKDGNPTCAAYYADNGELIKKIYYKGSSVNTIELYRNNVLYSIEKYENGNLRKKLVYNNAGKIISSISYEYNRQDKITAIRKSSENKRYLVEYGYDELIRVNSRTVKIDSEVVAEQYYRYDILDRIAEYKDKNQTITVDRINANNELISYRITDRIGNTINIKNKFLCSEYIGTEIDLNGHTTTLKDKSYIDNVMLRKPFTDVDDLDFVISNISSKSNKTELETTKRFSQTDIINTIIDDNLSNNKYNNINKPEVLPISIRKRRLIRTA